ncbi:MAG: ADP-ribosylglycohydrolase family protein [Nitrospinota bacterium]
MLKKYQGCLIGLAIGDALGAPVEFLTIGGIRSRYGVDGIRDFDEFRGFAEGFYTDDTQMSIATARGIIDAEKLKREGDESDAAWSVYNRYLQWLDTQSDPELRRGPGHTCLEALGSGTMGSLEEKINDSKGCGGVMRTAPAGLAYPPGRAFEEGMRFAAVTHGHPSGYLSAGFLADAIARLTERKTIGDAIEKSSLLLTGYEGHEETLNKIDLVLELVENQHTVEYAIKTIGPGWVGEEALAIALYCSLVFQDSWEEAVLAAVNHSGDSDSTGAITGAIMGAALGIRAIPGRWVRDVENSKEILELAAEMYELFGS